MRFSSALFASLAAQVAFAGLVSLPSQTGIKSLDVGLTVVQGVQGAVEAEGKELVTFVKADLIPLAKTSLGIIAQQVEGINKTLTPYLLSVVQPLVEAQLGNVLDLLTRTEALAAYIKDLSVKLLAEGSQQTKKAIATEIKNIIDAIEPFVEPVTSLCKGLAGTSTSETGKMIAIAVDNLNYAAGASLDPIKDAIKKLI